VNYPFKTLPIGHCVNTLNIIYYTQHILIQKK